MYSLIRNDNYQLMAEVDEMSNVLLHLDIFNWKPSVLKEMRELFPDVKEALRLEGYAIAYTSTDNPKFVHMVAGGESLGWHPSEDGYVEIIRWVLEV